MATGKIQTYSGIFVFPLEFDEDQIRTLDIAQSLANQCRFTGHCHHFYSVAEHSILVMNMAREIMKDNGYKEHSDSMRIAKGYAIIHDASEAYLSDWPRPLKASNTEGAAYYRDLELKVQGTIYRKIKIGLSWHHRCFNAVLQADTLALIMESQIVMQGERAGRWEFTDDDREYARIIYNRLGPNEMIWHMQPNRARAEWLHEYQELGLPFIE